VHPLPWQIAAFVAEYARSFRPGKAAIAAGYSPKNAASAGSHLLNRGEVQEALAKHALETAAAAEISTRQVLQNMAAMANLDPAEFFKPGPDGKPVFRSVCEMPPHVRKCLKSIQVVRRNVAGGDGMTEEILKLEWESPKDANRLLMQHLGLLVEKVEHQVTLHALSKLSDEEFDRVDRESRARFEAALAERRRMGLLPEPGEGRS
jgi:hypothetical protein